MSVEEGDRAEARGPGHPLVLVLDHLRSAYNVGNILRLADGAGVERVVTCGYTATPPHPKVAKTARGADRFVRCEHYETALQAVTALQAQGYQVVAVETAPGALPLWDYPWRLPCALVLGNEALGVAPEALAACDAAVALPLFGRKTSLNVSNAAAAVTYAVLGACRPESDQTRSGKSFS